MVSALALHGRRAAEVGGVGPRVGCPSVGADHEDREGAVPGAGASKVGGRHPPGLGEPVVRVAKDEARSDDHHGAHDSPGGQDPARHPLLDVMAVRGTGSLVGSPVGRDGGGEGAGCPPIKVGRRSQRHGDQGARAAMESRAPPAKYRLGGRAIAVKNLLPFDPAAGAPGLGNVK